MIRKIVSTALLAISVAINVNAGSVEPTEVQEKISTEVLRILKTHHYNQLVLDEQYVDTLFDHYLGLLDGYKSFLLQSDITQLEKHKQNLLTAMRAGELDFAFSVYNRFMDRAESVFQHNIDLLESSYAFNFEDDESINTNAENRRWMETQEQQNDWWRQQMENSLLNLILNDKTEQEAREILAKRYKRQLKQLQETNSEDVFEAFMSAVTGVMDPHTTYFSPRASKNFDINMKLSLEGIGAVLQMEDDYIKVVRIVPGGPAHKQGELKAGDRIIGIAQGNDAEIVDLVGWRLDDAVELIRGPKESLAVLEVLSSSSESGDKSKIVKIIRDEVKLEEQAAKGEVIEVKQKDGIIKVGVIDIPAFYLDFEAYQNGDPDPKRTSADVFRILRDFSEQDVNAVIVDLRGNGGGSLHEATVLTDLFINPGPVVQIRSGSGAISRHQQARQGAFYRGPLVVMIDRLSASASEIFAGAIQDYGRGIIVGSQTYGKGTVQELVPLQQGKLKLTASKFYRVSGESTQHRGVIPDITLPSEFPLDQIGESNSKNALPWDTIAAAPHRNKNASDVLIELLQDKHNARIQHNPDFQYVKSSAALQLQYLEEDSDSATLNITKRKQLRKQRETTALELVNQRREAKGKAPYPDVKSWKKALEDIDVEQLPVAERDPRLMEASMIAADLVEIYDNPAKVAALQKSAK